eukprot:m.182779 g.182779  ORF g.182779 m.182779 type:complete len:911 (+) comp15626_c0_seq1:214-2946(+)
MTAVDSSMNVGSEPLMKALYERMLADPGKSSILSDYTKSMEMNDEIRQRRVAFTLQDVQRGSQLGPKQKQTPRASVFIEQVRLLEEKGKADLSVLEDMQEFARARAKLEAEHAQGLHRLAQQFHAKRKWPSLTYAKGHENILLIDLWRSVISMTMDEAKSLTSVSDRLSFLTGEAFDHHMQQRRGNVRTAQRVLERLQDDLFGLDIQVAETKQRYDAALKQMTKLRNATLKKRGANPNAAAIKKCEGSVEFARHQYLLEIAAANGQYTKYRNEQLPEVMDAATSPDIQFAEKFLKGYTALFGTFSVSAMKNLQRVDKLSSIMTPELERRTFLHKYRAEFPGRQLFERERSADESKAQVSHALSVDDPSARHTLLKMRGLLVHTCRTIDANQAERERQMSSLQSLLDNYQAAGSMFNDEQPKVVLEKMTRLHAEIEDAARTKAHLESKVQRLTEAGIEDESVTPSTKQVQAIDIGEAQMRESERRALGHRRASNIEDKRSVSKKSKARTSSSEGTKAPRRSVSSSATLLSLAASVPEAPSRSVSGPTTAAKENSRDLPRASTHSIPTPPPPPPATTTSKDKKAAPPVVRRRTTRSSSVSVVDDQRHLEDDEPIYEEPVVLRRASTARGSSTGAIVGTEDPRRALANAVLARVSGAGGVGAGVGVRPPKLEMEGGRARPRSTLLSPPPPPPAALLHDVEMEEDDLVADLPPPPPQMTATSYATNNDVMADNAPGSRRRSWVLSDPAGGTMFENVLQAELPERYIALYPYTASQDDDVSLAAGEYMYVLVVREDGWCLGINMRGEVGYFPASYVEKDTGTIDPHAPAPRLVQLRPNGTEGYGLRLHGANPPRVALVATGGSADQAGIRVGDIILESGGEPCSDLDAAFVTDKLSALAAANGVARLCVIRVEDN